MNTTKLITNKSNAQPLRDDRYGTVWETAGPCTGLTALSFAHAEVDVGKTLPEHFHARMAELYHIVSGHGIMSLNGDEHQIRPGDTISLPPGTVHSLINNGTEPVRILVATSPSYSSDDDIESKALKERAVKNYHWAELFRQVYNDAVLGYRAGIREPSKIVRGDRVAFLASIGSSPVELCDYVEDYCDTGEPAFEDVLLVTTVRREYFLTVQNGTASACSIAIECLPAMDAKLGGIVWLPRIIVKARAKLRGELPHGVMYGCGGDRPFLKHARIHVADFLRLVWTAENDYQRILQVVRHSLDSSSGLARLSPGE